MDYRKVYLTTDTDEDWPKVWCVVGDGALDCWCATAEEDGITPSCYSGCAAFFSSGEVGDFVMCQALPRDHCGAPAIIGELVEEPKDDI
jgi:hypothetical protein